MSKAAKQSIVILIVLLVAALGFAAYSFMEFKGKEKALALVEEEFDQAQTQFHAKEKKNAQVTQKLKNDINTVNSEKVDLVKKIKEIEVKAEEKVTGLNEEIGNVSKDRDKWKRRIDAIQEERDQLMVKISTLTKKLAEKPEPQIIYKEREVIREVSKAEDTRAVDVTKAPAFAPESGKTVDEKYWANLLKDKASLEIKIDALNEKMSAKSISVVEMRQVNEDLKLEVGRLIHEKEEIEVTIQHKSDVIDNLSLELARTKNDKKFISNRVEKLNGENRDLRSKMKQLVSVKNALEKSIVRVTQEKDKIKNQRGKTEALIQSKIDEIWQIKDELDHSIRVAQKNTLSSNEVELPPIVVSSGSTESFNSGEAAPSLNGRVISINEPNNFVIVDIGENTGIRLGDHLSVYRDSKYIARLEVIQVRKDISAADLKDQWSKIKVGDIIR